MSALRNIVSAESTSQVDTDSLCTLALGSGRILPRDPSDCIKSETLDHLVAVHVK